MKKPKSITIIGRRWFQRLYGNTYYSLLIIVDGKEVHKIPFDYGYGSMYEHTATVWLEANGYLPGIQHNKHGGLQPLWQHCRERGIVLTSQAIDVARKRDL